MSETTPGSASQPLSSGGIESTTRDNEPLYGGEITIGYFDPLPTSDVAVLVDALSSRFHKVRAERRPSPPWASPLLEWAAITITISSGMVMKGFLEEMGKDIWHGLRAGLYRLYTTAKSRAYYPSFHAFALETIVDGKPVTFRIESDTLTQAQFERALQAARGAIAADMLALEKVPWQSGELRYVLSWNPEDDSWTPVHVL